MWTPLAALAFLAGGLHLDDDVDTTRPVTKIVNLLKDMQQQLENEQEEDQKVYDEVACWCAKNDAEKTEAIKNAEQSINQLTAKIEELTAQSARLNTEITNLNKEVASNTQSLDTATALRQKQLAEFNAEEKDLLQSITSLKAAITVLSKHNTSLVQQDTLFNIASMLHHQMYKHAELLAEIVTPSQQKTVRSFIQNPSYSNQSGAIFGIMSNMLEEFQSNLAKSKKDEAEDVEAFQKLKAAKMEEISAAQDQVNKKTTEKADADQRLAQSKEDREDTRNSLSADEQFLMDLKEKCKMTDEEWEQRTKTRQEEILAVTQAIGILAGDEARDNFNKTVGFLQVSKDSRARAANLLHQVANKYHNPKISAIASSARLDAFTKVKKAIDDMVSQLLAEKEDEIKHKDWCVNELNSNRNNLEQTERDRSDSEAAIQNLTSMIKQMTDEINTLTKELDTLSVELKRGGEDREKANNEFQVTLKDQLETQRLLRRAVDVLKGFYEKQAKGTGFAQTVVEPPTGFKSYKNKDGGGVIGMLETVFNDSREVEKEAIHDEEQGQKAYEQFVKESNASIIAKTKQRINLQDQRAAAEEEKSTEESNHANLMTELEQLNNNRVDVHSSCDFVLKNFDIRQKARDEEVQALRQAKDILSGAKFQQFLQRY